MIEFHILVFDSAWVGTAFVWAGGFAIFRIVRWVLDILP
jgi:hypothetical protein